MTSARLVSRLFAAQTTSRSEAAEFVRMDEGMAVVNIGPSTVKIPCLGFTPPVPGMAVNVEWVNGSPLVKGPVRPLNPLGVVTAAGKPRATVLVDDVSYLITVMDAYDPVNGDQVLIDWNVPGGMVRGKVAAVDTPVVPPESGGGSKPFSVTVRAADSGRYQPGSGWWGNDPWASSSNDGIWVYGDRVRGSVGSGTVTRIEIYLPLVQEVGAASVGVHPHMWMPPGEPTITSKVDLPIGRRSGWQTLPVSFGTYVAAGGRGIAVADGGYNIWRGTASDSLSGALRISGTR